MCKQGLVTRGSSCLSRVVLLTPHMLFCTLPQWRPRYPGTAKRQESARRLLNPVNTVMYAGMNSANAVTKMLRSCAYGKGKGMSAIF